MKLTAVTITGADNNSDPARLEELSAEFPFVEWGILLSSAKPSKGRRRFPSVEWIEKVFSVRLLRSRLAGHVCGDWAKQIFLGSFPSELDLSHFRRVQLNIAEFFAKEASLAGPALATARLPSTFEYIVQVGGAMEEGIHAAEQLQVAGHSVSVLVDRSGGRGLSPDCWPTPGTSLYCGYAGGMGPDNLAHELQRLSLIAGDHFIWIDMQKNVRTDDGRSLDFWKVRRCLEIARPFCP